MAARGCSRRSSKRGEEPPSERGARNTSFCLKMSRMSGTAAGADLDLSLEIVPTERATGFRHDVLLNRCRVLRRAYQLTPENSDCCRPCAARPGSCALRAKQEHRMA